MAKKDNLKRGQLIPQPHGGAIQPWDSEGRPDNFVKSRLDRQSLRERVGSDEDASMVEIHRDLTKLCRVLLGKAEWRVQVPDKTVMEVVREFRLTQERITEMRRERGLVIEAIEFFVLLDKLWNDEMKLEDVEIESENLDADLEEIHKDLTSLARKIMRRAAREGKVPPRATMDVIRELRQTSEAVSEARRTRSPVAESHEFLATLESRRETVATRLAGDPVPIFTPTA